MNGVRTGPTPMPTPVVPDPASVPRLRWGVLGTGWIAERFTRTTAANAGQQMAAVGSRTLVSAQRFATAHGIERAHGSYEALVADPGVDVVYVATVHPWHVEHALLAIDAGKHVLVEKPFALNAAQARRIADRARAAGVFCMEAVWTLFLPRYDVVRRLLADGAVGQVRGVRAEMGEWFEPRHRINDPALAGGCMMDLGLYPVMFSLWVAGVPDEVVAVGRRTASGVVGDTAMALRTPAGVLSTLHVSITAAFPGAASIGGTHGMIELPGPFYQPGAVRLQTPDGGVSTYDEPLISHDGLYYQAVHVADCIGAGRLESPVRPLADSIATAEVMDRVRACTDDRLLGE